MGRPDSGVSVTDERDAPREHPRSQKEIKGSDHMIALYPWPASCDPLLQSCDWYKTKPVFEFSFLIVFLICLFYLDVQVIIDF